MTRTLTLTCEHCGKQFESNRKKRFCSRHCADRHRYEDPENKHHYIPVTNDAIKCAQCGELFIPAKKGQQFCSGRCRDRYYYKEKLSHSPRCVICGSVIPGGSGGSKYCSKKCQDEAHKKICKECGKEFIPKCGDGYKEDAQFCSVECANNAQRDKTVYICKECGKPFHRRNRFEDQCLFCSRTCAIKYRNRELYEKWGEDIYLVSSKKRRRYRIHKNGDADHSITIDKLYERDRGICGICGKPVDMSADSNSNEYGSIDHIVPLAKGGKHTWDNVQLAHRSCNSEKRDTLYIMLKIALTG